MRYLWCNSEGKARTKGLPLDLAHEVTMSHCVTPAMASRIQATSSLRRGYSRERLVYEGWGRSWMEEERSKDKNIRQEVYW